MPIIYVKYQANLKGIVLENFAKREDLCQVSLTGIRSLVLLGLLIKSPRSLEEIRAEFINSGIMSPSNSDDILRIDLNTLKFAGCEISRADKSTNFKYKLLSCPFSIKITEEEISLLKKVYNKIKHSIDIETLLNYDSLIKKLAEQIYNNDIKDALLGLSPFKHQSLEIINELIEDCKNHNLLKIIYKKPTAKYESEKEIAAQEIVFQNDKLYLYGYDINKKESVSLNIKRIKSILSRQSGNDIKGKNPTVVKFKLKQIGILGLKDCESILSGDCTSGYIIEGTYHNKFIATQRILSFGSDCTVIEPRDFKQEIIKSLIEMREIYNGQ